MGSEETTPLLLRESVQRFKVCWKVWPECIYVGDQKRQVGYQLELAGTHEAEVAHPRPGCEQCQSVYNALRQIAEYIIPREERPSTYEIGPFDRSIHYWPLHSNRPDVLLTIKILHRRGSDQPVDECEDRCLEEMEARLRELGACRLRWTDPKARPTAMKLQSPGSESSSSDRSAGSFQ